MRMDRPNGVHNEERTFLDRIAQLKSILRNRCGDGRWSCHLDGAVLAAVPESASVRRPDNALSAVNIHSTGIFARVLLAIAAGLYVPPP
jgi:hypothetical protein